MGEREFNSVLLGFSGGVDSVTAVNILRDKGSRVVALTLDTVGDRQMIADAVARAQMLGVEHLVKDVSEDFQRSIVDYFVKSYSLGRTPAPCTVCNNSIKWRYLQSEADRLGIDAIATGHYFNVEKFDGRYYVARAADERKDQSYYLWGLKQDVLSRVITPMGQAIKQEVKQDAQPLFSKVKESMGLCFLQGKMYRDFLVEHNPKVLCEGEIITEQGEVVGRHDGVAFYTIGQKRGLDMSLQGVSVVAIDAQRNRLIVGDNSRLYHDTLEVKDCNIVWCEEFMDASDVKVVVRGIGRNPEGFAREVSEIDGGFRIRLSNPAWAPAVGQPVVFYRGNRVIGGGVLEAYY